VVTANAGWVSVGITSDTAQFAVASIRRWLDEMGRERYPDPSLTLGALARFRNPHKTWIWGCQNPKV
jgi:hypothetical protein